VLETPRMEQNTDQPENAATPNPTESAEIEITERDIVFDCPHCGGELVIDQAGAGMRVDCPFCHTAVEVPEYKGPSLRFLQTATATLARSIQAARTVSPKNYEFQMLSTEELKRRQTELQRAIRENQAQATEIKGHIHHATIQLHRYRLKLEVNQERQAELKAELEAIQTTLAQKAQPPDGGGGAGA
jgi:predicted RNA-binding Zn-ribbon protein involved in translation (DUF1610 family)